LCAASKGWVSRVGLAVEHVVEVVLQPDELCRSCRMDERRIKLSAF